MPQLKVQIAFAAFFVLAAFDEFKNGPVKIKSILAFDFFINNSLFCISCRREFGGHKALDTLHAQLLSQHGCPGIVSKQKRHKVTDCVSNVCIGR